MKNKKKYLVKVVVVTLFIISIINIVDVKANERTTINLILSENGEISPPVFDISDEYIYPGAEINKDFVLKNGTQNDYNIQNIELKNFSIKDIDGKILDFYNDSDLKIIEEFYKSIQCSISYEGTFSDKTLYADDIKELIKGKTFEKEISISSGNGKNINVAIAMKKEAGNNMQGLQANFDIVFNAISLNEGQVVQPPIDPPTKPIELPIETPIENRNVIGDTDNIYKGLVKTGSPIDTLTLSLLGLSFIVIGFIIFLRRKSNTIKNR